MANELEPTKKEPNISTGVIAIEQERAIAEAKGKIMLAKMFPRDLYAARAELMEACNSPAFAEKAFYSVPNRGAGPSIRFAEEVARVYGNFDYGYQELSTSKEKTEIEVYAWDVEKNNRLTKRLTVNHVLDTKFGPKVITSQTDIHNCVANVAAKQMRGRILAALPKWLVAEAEERCKATLAGNGGESISAQVRKMSDAFSSKYGITVLMIEEYIKSPLSSCTVEDLANLRGVYNALKEGAKVADYFQKGKKEEIPLGDTAAAIADLAANAESKRQEESTLFDD